MACRSQKVPLKEGGSEVGQTTCTHDDGLGILLKGSFWDFPGGPVL